MKNLFLASLALSIAMCMATPAIAQIGGFQTSTDIGDVGAPGSATAADIGGGDFGAANFEYEIEASGADIWGTADEFHFVYMEVEGDFTIFGKTDIVVGDGDPTWTKSGLMCRNDLTAGSAYAYAMMRSNLDFMAQWRDEAGAEASSSGDDFVVPADQIQDFFGEGVSFTMALERRGNTFNYYYVSAETGERVLQESHVVPDMQDPVFVGMAVTSHNDGSLATGFWQNVGIEFRSFNIYETFSYLDNSAGDSLEALAGGLDFAGEWTASGALSPSELSTTILEAGLVVNQPSPDLNTGGFSAKISGNASDGITRRNN